MLEVGRRQFLTPRVGCAILAAGAGVRFGGDGRKQRTYVGGRPLLQYAIDAACRSHALHCSLIVGASLDRVLAAVDTRRCAVYVNHQWAAGIATSIRAVLPWHSSDAACILLVADQPDVTAADLDALINGHEAERDAIVCLRRDEVWGSPLLFPCRDFGSLMALEGDRGAKSYAQTQRSRLLFVEAARASAFLDIDRPDDVARFSD